MAMDNGATNQFEVWRQCKGCRHARKVVLNNGETYVMYADSRCEKYAHKPSKYRDTAEECPWNDDDDEYDILSEE